MIELMLEIRIYFKWYIIVHYENTFFEMLAICNPKIGKSKSPTLQATTKTFE